MGFVPGDFGGSDVEGAVGTLLAVPCYLTQLSGGLAREDPPARGVRGDSQDSGDSILNSTASVAAFETVTDYEVECQRCGAGERISKAETTKLGG